MLSVDHAEHLMREGAFDEAKNLLSQILSDDPDDLRAICDIGIAYTETGENQKAIRALEHYVARDVGNAHAWEALGCACFRTGDFPRARDYLAQSLNLSPESPSCLRNMGILHGMEGRPAAGIDLLNRSAALAPDDYRTLYALSYAQRDNNSKAERNETLNKLAQLKLPEEVRRDVVLTRIRINLGWE